MSDFIPVRKNATYKGYRVFLSTRDNENYHVSFSVTENAGKVPHGLLCGMRNIAKGEYYGTIHINDHDLKIIDESE